MEGRVAGMVVVGGRGWCQGVPRTALHLWIPASAGLTEGVRGDPFTCPQDSLQCEGMSAPAPLGSRLRGNEACGRPFDRLRAKGCRRPAPLGSCLRKYDGVLSPHFGDDLLAEVG